MDARHYTDKALQIFIDDLDEGEQTLLRLSAALPATFKELEPSLTSKDIARMIELLEEQ